MQARCHTSPASAQRLKMDHPWHSAGVETTALAWTWRACAVAALWCGLYVVVLLPALVVYTVVCTFLDAVAAVVSRTPAPAPLRRDARPELVFPGTCTWVFWQLGMVQYLVERYDLRGVRVVGTSSGAVAAAAIMLLEHGDPSAAEVRKRAQRLHASLDTKLERITGHPLAYVGRLDGVMAELLDESLPRDDAAYRTDRILIGLRRWTWTPLPSLSPTVSQKFSGRADFARAALASANAMPVAALRPAIRYAGAWCADGVNAFSLWCAVPYLCAVMRGAAVAAPRETVNGAAALPWNHIYAAWNWPVLDHVLSMTRGRRYFVTPTAGGHVDLSRLLLVSRRWVATLWADGYRHAATLDAGGYFEGLAPRRAV